MRSKTGAGVVAGLLAGLIYGVVMQIVTIPMPGAVGMPGGGLRWGLLYGVFWWLAGTLVLMPVLLGMPAFAPLRTPMLTGALWSLVGYLLAGPLLGLVFAALYRGGTIAGPRT